MSLPIAALAGGSFIFIAVITAFLFAVVFGFYTLKGSAINHHPNDGLDGAPGSEEPGRAAGSGRVADVHPDETTAGGAFSTHGTR